MSQRVWLVSVMAAALGVLGIAVERSRSQESSQEVSQPQAEASGDPVEGAATADDPFGDFGGRNYHGGGRARGEDKAARPSAAPVPAAPRIWVAEDPERIQRIYEIIKSPLSSSGLEFPGGTPLEEIVAYLSEEYDIPIVLDNVALDELGIGADEPIAINLRNVRLDQALRRMLEPLELTYVVDNGVLLVTSEEEALTKLRLAIYDVRDLLLQGDYDSLIEIITATIASDTWAENGGGEAEIRAYPQRGVLVVSQTISVHELIDGLLTSMRAAPLDPDAKPLSKAASSGQGGGGAGCGGEHQAMNAPTPAVEQVDPQGFGGGVF